VNRDKFERLRERLREKAEHPAARAVTYVALGDSVTQGCMGYGVVEYESVYHQALRRRMERRFPRTVVNAINSGVEGDSADASRQRWDRDVFLYQPDLVTIGFGLNDAHAGPAGLDRFIHAIRDLVVGLRARTDADIVLFIPGMMMKRDNERIHPEHRAAVPGFLQVAEEGYLLLYIEALRKVAREMDLPYVDSYRIWEKMEEDGIDIHTRLANGINHPDPAFHEELAEHFENTIFGA